MNPDERARFTYTNEALLENLRELDRKLGRPPLRREITRPSVWVYYQRFGSFANALREAGLNPIRLTRREVFG